ncbi:ATP-binding cassette domain-containing protein [Salipiger sp.]|uniref:ATP-binding cassette domain-containing protein n=1 Tax=Salipiger sp. TaxID=2078585 RepID=UPI003A97AA76
MIEVTGLHVRIGEAALLKGVDLRIPAGGITALIGPNGAGKSTLLHAMAGLQAVSAGTVRIDGMDVASAQSGERARRLAMLTQSQPMLSRLAVRDLVAFGRWPHCRGRPGPKDRRIVEEALDAFALQDHADRQIDTLSGGQRQRAYVAMTWAQATPWLFLDEPLAALDPRHASDLMTRLGTLGRGAEGRSVVIVLHDLNAAAAAADHVVALKDGAVFAAGPTAEVMCPDRLSALFDTSFLAYDVPGRRLVYPA